MRNTLPDLSSTVVFITGAANGIGRSLSLLCYHQGARVIATDQDSQKLKLLAEGLDQNRFCIIQLDVRSADNWNSAFDQAVEEFDCIDILMNVAGVIEPDFLVDTSFDDINFQIDVNLKGTIYGSQVAARHMDDRGEGCIINFGSLASLAAVPGLNIYSASKFGVRGFTLAIAEELAEKGIHVSLVCPDAVKTPMLDHQKDRKAAALTFSGSRYLNPDEVAEAVLIQSLKERKREVWLPSDRAVLALSSSFLPAWTRTLRKWLTEKGIRNQANYNT